MRLKSFYANTMNEAMQMVRETLGDDAVIVASRENNDGVHVTAALDPAFEIGTTKGRKSSSLNWLQYDEENDEEQIAEDLTDILLRHAVPEEVIDHIISCATIVGLDNPETAMRDALEHLFTFHPLPSKPYEKPIMMLGTSGAGKTVMVAKAATRAIMLGMNTALITCDTIRAGGVAQLETFAKLLDVKCYTAKTPDELMEHVETLQSYDQIFIDTPGVNPFDTKSVGDVKQFCDVIDSLNVLVLPAGMDNRDCAEIAKTFSTLNAALLMPSRLDAARRYGGLFAAAHYGGLAFSDASHTPKIANGLVTLTPATLAFNVMHGLDQRGDMLS